MRSLVLFYDLYCSMTLYDAQGLLLRDLLLYEKLIEAREFNEVRIFTYDRADCEKLAALHHANVVSKNIRVLTPPRILNGKLGSIVYSLIGPIIHRKEISSATLLKTHQVSGSWAGLISKWLYGKPLLFRLGYPLSLRFKTEGKPLKHRITRFIEKLMTRYSDHVAVTSRTMQEYYGAMTAGKPVTHAPSYVDISGFTPITSYDATKPIAFIGRLEPVKNIHNLIIACSRLNIALDVYGDGGLRSELAELARSLNAQVTFHGFVSNDDLKTIHHRHSVYVLCSTREGMPKSLIEAMASGLICVSTRTDGALELIEDGKTGHIIDGYDAESIARTLRRVLHNLDPAIGQAASALMQKENSVEHCLEIEVEILRKLVPPADDAGEPKHQTHPPSLRAATDPARGYDA